MKFTILSNLNSNKFNFSVQAKKYPKVYISWERYLKFLDVVRLTRSKVNIIKNGILFNISQY